VIKRARFVKSSSLHRVFHSAFHDPRFTIQRFPRQSSSRFDIRHLPAIFRLPMNLLINFCLVLFVLVAALMVLVILMQRPKSEGLGAAFGGGVTENIFGAQTTNVLVKFTTWLAGIFFALTFALSVLYAHHSVASSAFRRELMKNQPAPQTSPAPAGAQSSPGTTPAQASPAVSPAASAAPTGSPKS
jgi:preprotein translocase subunit SecG